jgi:multiple sugar transport system permease protein
VKPRAFASRVAFAGFASLVGMFFALPMLWLVFAPFNSRATLAAKPSRPSLDNFREVFVERSDVPRALGISALLVIGTVVIVVAVGAPASYALSRIHFPGRDVFLYMLLLLSSVVAGSAAILPLYLLMFELGLIDTYRGIWLALAGGLLPASMFILKDFTDSYTFQDEGGGAEIGPLAAFALVYTIPILVLYWFVNKRYGFRFHGGIKR